MIGGAGQSLFVVDEQEPVGLLLEGVVMSRTAHRFTILVALAVAVVAFTPVANAADGCAIGEGAISGTVTHDGTGYPLADILVVVYSPGCEASGTWSPVNSTHTDASGDYLFEELTPNRHIVRFMGHYDGYVSEYYDNVLDPGSNTLPSAAQEVVVVSGALVSGIDAALVGEPPPPSVVRLAGPTRYETAVAITQHFYGPGVPAVFIARGDNFPDALAGGPPAGMMDSPMLLVATNSIPAAVATELTRLAPKEIFVLGGSDVVSSAVETQLATYTTGAVTRLEGNTRYETAVAITQHFYDPGVQSVFVATGENFPDALAGVPAAALKDSPLLLVRNDSIPAAVAAELTRLAPKSVYVLGGSDVVSSAVETQLDAYGLLVTRLEGNTRYETAARITWFFGAVHRYWPLYQRMGSETVFIARGDNFPDALAGGPPAGMGAYPLLLVQQNSIPTAVANELTRMEPREIYVLGGADVVSDVVATQLATYLVARPSRVVGFDVGPGGGSGEVVLSWNKNPEPDIKMYRIYDGYSPMPGPGYTHLIDVPYPLQSQPGVSWWEDSGRIFFLDEDATPGSSSPCYWIAAVDTEDQGSDLSPRTCYNNG